MTDAAPRCDCCGADQAAPTQYNCPLCPTCTTKYALATAASDHLRFLMQGAFTQWLDTWQGYPHTIRHSTDEAGLLAKEVMEELLPARLAGRQA